MSNELKREIEQGLNDYYAENDERELEDIEYNLYCYERDERERTIWAEG